MRTHCTILTRATALLLGCALTLPGTLATAQQDDGQPNWTHPRGGMDGVGVAHTELADSYELAWTYATGGAVLSSPVIANGVVYVGSEDKHLHAINAATGERVWAFEAATLIDASPVVDNGFVYIGTDGGVLHALDAATGEERWHFETGGRIAGEVGIARYTDGSGPRYALLVGSHDGLLYCLDPPSGLKHWDYETGDYINCGIVIEGGTAVVGGCDTYLHHVDISNGTQIAEVSLGGEVAATPAIVDGVAYLGHMQSEVLAVDLETHEVLWRFRDRDFPFVGSPAISGDRLLIGTRGRRMYCINRQTGEALWDTRTHGGIEGAPVIAGNRAVFGSAGGRLTIININDGQTVWEYDLGGAIDINPAVTDALIVVGCEDGNLYAFRPTQ